MVKYLFSYGSNGLQQLSSRLNRTVDTCHPGYLQNYTRIFGGYNENWKGAVASIIETTNKRVYGILVPVSIKDIELLDKFETGYYRKVIYVYNQKLCEHVKAYVYIMRDPTYVSLPSKEYLDAISKMLKDRKSKYNGILKVHTALDVL